VAESRDRLRRADRLRRPWEFRRVNRAIQVSPAATEAHTGRVKQAGRRLATPRFVVLIAASEEEGSARRLGITVSRRVGSAVVRNRLKRAVREWFRKEREQLESGVDVVVIARRPAAGMSGREVDAELRGLTAAGESSR
jgi:ribonuclease P protein component